MTVHSVDTDLVILIYPTVCQHGAPEGIATCSIKYATAWMQDVCESEPSNIYIRAPYNYRSKSTLAEQRTAAGTTRI